VHFVGYLCNCLSVSSRLVTVLRAELSGVWIHAGAKVFFVASKTFRPAVGPAQPPIQWVTGFLSLGSSGRVSSWPLTSSAEVKNEWSYSSTPPVCLHSAEGDRDPFLPLCFKYVLVYQVASSGLPTKSVCISDPIRRLSRIS